MNAIVATETPQFFLDVRATVDEQVVAATSAAQKARDEAVEMVVDDDAMLDIASNHLRDLATATKQLDGRRKEYTAPLDAQKTYIMDVFRGPQNLIAEGETSLRTKVSAYMREQEAIAAKARAAIREREEAERNAAVERQRKADEEAAELLRKAETAKPAAAAELQEQAAQAQQRSQDAAAAVELAEYAPSQAVAVASPKAAGIATRGKWTFRDPIDLHTLVKAAAEKPELLIYLQPDTKRLAQFATMMKGDARVPGVEFFEDKILAVRSR